MTTNKDFDDVFAEGETAPSENPADALRAQRLQKEETVSNEFTSEFEKDETAEPQATVDSNQALIDAEKSARAGADEALAAKDKK